VSDKLAKHIAEEVARLLPLVLDEEALAILAARLRPLITDDETRTRAESLLTTTEAAAHARVNVETIRRAIRAGVLPVAAKIGRSPRISEVALDEWLADTASHTTAPSVARTRRSPRRPGAAEGSLKTAWSGL